MPADRLIHPKLGHSEKVSKLSDFEFRVWVQYILSADDFGVSRASAVTLQSDNDAIACRSPKSVQKAIDHIVGNGLVRTFEHQGRAYLYQPDWQEWQKVEYPRATNNPKAPTDKCDDSTTALLDKHPGGNGKRKEKDRLTIADDSPNVPQMFPEGSPPTRAGAPAKRLTANGIRLTANGLEGGSGETGDPPMDVWARELVNLYPPQGRCSWALVERPLFAAVMADPSSSPWLAWQSLKHVLERHKRSHQWRVKLMIPRLDKWLREGIYLQELPENPVSTLVNEKTERTLSSAATFIKAGER